MNTAAKVRADKDTHPERYCHVPSCLWRVHHHDGRVTPCRKHGNPQVEMPIEPSRPMGQRTVKVHLSDYEMRVRSVRCTYCGAREQSNCRDERDGNETRPHHARHLVYERKGQ